MPTEARIRTSIWRDPDFLALPRAVQGTYMFLFSQPDISLCGVLPLREEFWTEKASELSTDELRAHLDLLAARRFVVIDDRTLELLVRSRVRRDEVLVNSKLIKPLARACEAVDSGRLRGVLAAEIKRCQAEGIVHPRIEAEVDRLVSVLERSAQFSVDALFSSSPMAPPQADSLSVALSDAPSHGASDRARGTGDRGQGKGEGGSGGELALLNGSGRGPATDGKPGNEAEAFDEFWTTYPRRVGKGAARTAWAKAVRKIDPAEIIKAAAGYRDWPGRKPDFTAHPTTWLNQERWTDELPAGAQAGPFDLSAGIRSMDPGTKRPALRGKIETD
jgi:hypothetical protein